MEAGFTAERLGTAYGLCPLVHIATTSGVLAKLVYTANSQANRMSVGWGGYCFRVLNGSVLKLWSISGTLESEALLRQL